MTSGARWAGQAGNGWRTQHAPCPSHASVRLFGWCRTENAPCGDVTLPVALVVPSLRRARREAGHGLASFWPASDANARRLSSRAAVGTPPLTWVRPEDWSGAARTGTTKDSIWPNSVPGVAQ